MDTNGQDSCVLQLDNLPTSYRIRVMAMVADQNMALWARELGVSRQYIYQVVKGTRKNQRIRSHIEKRLGETFWPEKEVQQ
ncbi:hypothetical protein DSCW_60220 [Desulfosarcina widdelii]|uniref:HTH cro/C1-type domain-containing protein n=1 Tax=Desulfosarcina widdelii TaxID=947919 RepID=A0A5K7ZCV0_9BACT|nr:hypothetical protein [Desulfosarcina widdelii]BBO78605.1 hypothetical protein DSCW_60220 [Desulfosarcina widdelii]